MLNLATSSSILGSQSKVSRCRKDINAASILADVGKRKVAEISYIDLDCGLRFFAVG